MSYFTNKRILERKESIDKLEELKRNLNKVNVIHYSCESLHNTTNTPRITSICIKNKGNNNTKVFSIHIEAQKKRKAICCLSESDLEVLEKSLLNDFTTYVKKHKDYYWVHWNMRNTTYGFDAISNRSSIVGAKSFDIPSDKRFNLCDILIGLYTAKYQKDILPGKMLNTAYFNGITTTDVLRGEDEAKAFANREYQKLSLSSCRKTEIIDDIFKKTLNQELKVKSNLIDIYGLSPSGINEIINNNKLLSIIKYIVVGITAVFLERIYGEYVNEIDLSFLGIKK